MKDQLVSFGVASTDPLPNLPPNTTPKSFRQNPPEIYTNVIKDNPLVCPHCFRRQKTRWKTSSTYYGDYARKGTNKSSEVRGKMLSWIDEYFPPDAKHPLLDREFYQTEHLPNRTTVEYPSDTVAGTKRRACTGCGHMDREKSTLSKGEAITAAYNVSYTLGEYGIGHDWVHLVESVRELKSIEDWAGDDDAVFAKAIAEAVWSAQSCPCPATSAGEAGKPTARLTAAD